MEMLSRPSAVLSEINRLTRIKPTDSDDAIKNAFQQLLSQWPEVLAVANLASDDELFLLNASRAFLSELFTIALAKDYFETDHSFTRQTLRTCLDLLNNYIDIFTNSNNTFCVSNICLIMLISSSIVSFLRCTDIDLFNERETRLLQAMRVYVDEDFTHDNLTDGIVSFVWNLADNTLLIPFILSAGYASSLTEWMITCQKKFREDKQDGLLSILLNMLRHDDGIDQFSALDALDAVQHIPMRPDHSLQLSMITVLLSDVKQMKFESIPALDKLIELLVSATSGNNHRHDGAHVSEPLTTLAKLFYNDEILVSTLRNVPTEPPLIELFVSLLLTFYPKFSRNNNPLENSTCVLVMNILWLVSCHAEYRQIIAANESLMSIIESAANNEKNYDETFMPRTMKSMQSAAEAIRKNVEEQNENLAVF